MRERLQDVIADLFGCLPNDIPHDGDLRMLDGWDSLHHLELMLELEAEFKIRIPTETMAELTSMGRIEDYLSEHAATT
jgi:acyl carrier protein